MATRYKRRPPTHRKRFVQNFSQRGGQKPRAVALHSTESQDLQGTTDDLMGVESWFDNPKSQASSHIGVDGDGNSSYWVPSDAKAWTILDLNAVTLNIELVGRASQAKKDWETAQLKTAAKWTAYWCIRYGIPPRRGKVGKVNGAAMVTRTGIITHYDLTLAGFGTHTDPGANFPMTKFLAYVKYYYTRGWTLGITK